MYMCVCVCVYVFGTNEDFKKFSIEEIIKKYYFTIVVSINLLNILNASN